MWAGQSGFLPVPRGTWLWPLFCRAGLQGSGMFLAIGQSPPALLGNSLPTGHLGTMGVPLDAQTRRSR